MKCECINIKHLTGRCSNNAVLQCKTCTDRLCPPCAKSHHFHTTFSPIKPERAK